MDPKSSVSIAIRLLAKLIPWLILKCFPEKRLDDLLEIFPRPTGDSVDIYFPGRRATCWLRVINLTPFEIKLDRVEVKVVAGGVALLIHKVMPEVVQSLGRVEVFCEDSFDADPEAFKLAKAEEKIRLEISGHIVLRNRSFTVKRSFDDLRGYRING